MFANVTSREGRKQHNARINTCLLTWIAAAGISPHAIGHQAFLELAAELDPKWVVPSPTTIVQSHLVVKAARIDCEKIKYLCTKNNLSTSFDGGSAGSNSNVTICYLLESWCSNRCNPFVSSCTERRLRAEAERRRRVTVLPIGTVGTRTCDSRLEWATLDETQVGKRIGYYTGAGERHG